MRPDESSPVEIIPAGAADNTAVAIRDTGLRDRVAADWLLDQTRENTAMAYRRDIQQWFAWCDRWNVDALAATATHIRGYRRDLANPEIGRPPAVSTQHRKLCAVSSFYAFASENHGHLVPANPAAHVKRPKVANESTTAALELDEVQALFREADRVGLWEAALVRMLFYSGARVSEICTATVGDLRWERGARTLWVTRKGGKRFRLVIPTPAADALAAHLGNRRSGYLFPDKVAGRPISRHHVSYKLVKLVESANIVDQGGQLKQITPHSLRHTAVTIALDAGSDIREVQRMVGHERIDTTLRYDRSRSVVERSPSHTLAATVEPVIEPAPVSPPLS